MSIKILIVEDEILIAEDISFDLTEMGFNVVDIAISDKECFSAFDQYSPDVLIMDIKIKGKLNGIEVVNSLKKNHSIPVIYLSSNTDSKTLKEAVDSQPQAFLTKPYNKKELKLAIELAFLNHNQVELTAKKTPKTLQASVFVKNGDLYQRIELNSINFIEAAGSYSTVFTDKGEYILSSNLQNFENKIEHPNFVRIHRSFIVNITKIEGFDNNSILINGKHLPISKSHKAEVLNYFQKL